MAGPTRRHPRGENRSPPRPCTPNSNSSSNQRTGKYRVKKKNTDGERKQHSYTPKRVITEVCAKNLNPPLLPFLTLTHPRGPSSPIAARSRIPLPRSRTRAKNRDRRTGGRGEGRGRRGRHGGQRAGVVVVDRTVVLSGVAEGRVCWGTVKAVKDAL